MEKGILVILLFILICIERSMCVRDLLSNIFVMRIIPHRHLAIKGFLGILYYAMIMVLCMCG